MVLAVLCAQSSRKSQRILAGVCIGMAALARLYPILLLLVVVRRRDWGLVVACFTTVALGYLPFLLLGHGDIRSVLFSFSGQQDLHPGVLDMAPIFIASEVRIRVDLPALFSVTHKLEMAIVGVTILVICIQRLRRQITEEAALLILIAEVLMVYAHIFPWYVTALLPWIALMVWYFTFTVV
jgi:Glycosyltransferase family 87